MTFYLKYRPQSVFQLDLSSVRKELESILKSGSFAHAYLFSGPRGTGKTSAARILAKVLNCERNKEAHSSDKKKTLIEPCNKCNSCKQVMAGVSLDLVEIDAASNRGIDDIRDLRERIKLAPVQSIFKVYIIDEVHMLTQEAFNALLKTLEEPPLHAVFFLCTTEPEKIPETIVSRCTRVQFKKASIDEVVLSLKKVVRGEKLVAETGVLETVAETVDGSFRDGMKILEQLVGKVSSGKGGKRKIKIADVNEVLGLSGEETYRKFVKALGLRDKKSLFSILDEIYETGISLNVFIRGLLERLRLLMLIKIGVNEGEEVDGLEFSEIRRLIKLFSAAGYSLRTTEVKELPIELALAEWLNEAGVGQQPERESLEEKPVKKASRLATHKLEEEKHIVGKEKLQKPEDEPGDFPFEKVIYSWPGVLEKLRPQNHSVEALLKAARPVRMVGNSIVVEVAYKFHKEQLELPRYKAMVEAAIREVVSPGLKLRYDQGELPKRVRDNVAQVSNISENSAQEDEESFKDAEEIFNGED